MGRLGDYGPLPTVGSSRAAGVTSFTVHCTGVYCHNQRVFTFEEVGLVDEVVFIDIWLLRRFRCTRCGAYSTEIRAVWPYKRPAAYRR